MDIEDFLQRYLVQLEADGRSRHTIGQYRRHIRLLTRWLAQEGHGGGIRHEDLAAFLSSPTARTRADGTPKRETSRNALRSSLRTFFRFLHLAGYLKEDPARLIRRAHCAPPPPKSLSDAEQERLIDAVSNANGNEAERDHLLYSLMLATGIRVGSALALDVDDVDLEQGELWLRRTKGNRPERVFLGSAIRDHLRRYLTGSTEGPVFRGRHGGRISARQAQRRLSTWLERARITRPASLHSLRHTFATNLYRRTRDLFLVKEALRHKSISSTLVYARVEEDRLRQVLE